MRVPGAPLIAAGLLLLYATLGISFALHSSPTWDEVPTFGQGLYLARSARWDIPGCLNHPPLSFYLQALPLACVGLDEGDAWTYRAADRPSDPALDLIFRGVYDVARGQGLLYRNASRFPEDRLTNLARLPNLALGLLTGLLLFLWGRRLHGDAGGLLGLVLFALSPNTIAHGALATTDMPMMLFTLAAGFALERTAERPTLSRAALTGVLWGLACLSKYTALLLLAPFTALLAVAAWRGATVGGKRAALIRTATLLAVLGGAAAVTIAAGYQGRVQAFLDGIEYQRVNVRHGQMGFMLGMKDPHGWWYYYPFVMAVKSPLGELLLAVIGAVAWIRREKLSTRLLLATGPFLFLLAFFLWKRLPVGYRHLLPVLPAIYLLAGATLAWRWRWPRLQLALSGLLAAWVGMGTARIHPDELAFFNEAAGGPSNGYRLLVDSSLDWGQSLKELRTWMQGRGLAEVQLSYFGTADPAYYGIRYRALPSFFLRNLSSEPREWPPRGLVAVSASCYWGVPWEENPFAFLHRLKPVDQIGHSILIFDVP